MSADWLYSRGFLVCVDYLSFTRLPFLMFSSSLSGLLAETTGKDLYLAAATESADFIHNHLLNAQNIVQDGISVQANDSCAINEEALNGDQQSCNSGLMIDGLVILYSITQNASIFDT
jgi:hypothetical protein